MARNRYDDDGPGAILRWLIGLVLAAGITLGTVALGRIIAQAACDGACAPLEPLGAFLRDPLPVIGGSVTWAMGIATVLGILLWSAISRRPVSWGLALVLILALLAIGAAMAGLDRQIVEVPEPVVIAEPEPEPLPLTRPQVPECPAGNFWNGEGCLPCEETVSQPAAAGLFFAPVRFEAAWGYANDRRWQRFGGVEERPIGDLVIDGQVSLGGRAVCASQAILVIGSASSDGPRGRNLDRARRRAERLAERVEAACPGETTVFAMTFGQSTAATDMAEDRALTVIGLDTPDGSPIDPALIESELGYVLDSGVVGATLIDRAGNFPMGDWSWVGRGRTPVTVTPGPRPFENVRRLRADAPATCPALAD